MSSSPLSIVFNLPHPEQVETLHALRTTFQGRSDLEALTPDTFVLHLWPGCARCVEGDETRESSSENHDDELVAELVRLDRLIKELQREGAT